MHREPRIQCEIWQSIRPRPQALGDETSDPQQPLILPLAEDPWVELVLRVWEEKQRQRAQQQLRARLYRSWLQTPNPSLEAPPPWWEDSTEHDRWGFEKRQLPDDETP